MTDAGMQFDQFHPDYTLDPYPALASLQESEPVFYAPSIESWVI